MKQGSTRSLGIPFVANLARGILRDGRARRRTMGALVLAASILLMAGATFGANWLAATPLLFLCYWLVVAWLTCTALLMAAFDMLLVRKAGQAARKRLRRELLDNEVAVRKHREIDKPPTS